MNNKEEPPDRSGGIDFDQSDVHAEDVIGRDKIEINLPANARGCYAQLAKNIKFAIFFGIIMLLIYLLFQINRPRVEPQTPTPTVAMTATPKPTGTAEPVGTPTVDDQLSLLGTATVASPLERTTTPRSLGEETPPAGVTSGPVARVSPTRGFVNPTASATQRAAATSAPAPRSPTPTLRPTPTPTLTPPPATPVPSPRPSPTAMPRPPTPTTSSCAATAVRVGPVAKLATEGDRFTINVLISCVEELAGYQVELQFDPEVVTVEGVRNDGFLAGAGGSVFVVGPIVNNAAGSATIGATVLRPGPYPSGSGTLASFMFEAVGRGSTGLSLSAWLSDSNGEGISAGVSGGTVLVQPGATQVPGSP